jgi:2Fe-2S ferredoxin
MSMSIPFHGKLPPPSEDENDLLDSSDHRNEFRACPARCRSPRRLEGLRVTIAQED